MRSVTASSCGAARSSASSADAESSITPATEINKTSLREYILRKTENIREELMNLKIKIDFNEGL